MTLYGTQRDKILGMVQHSGEIILKILPNVQQVTIKPDVLANVAPNTLIYPGEYNIYKRLTQWSFAHKTVNHSAGKYARDLRMVMGFMTSMSISLRAFSRC
ncbi:MAG: transposase [Chloroflexi bacterium]|nr:transposase [Chloroflexota bacterium]